MTKNEEILVAIFFWDACWDKNDEIKTYYVKLNSYSP